MEAGPELDRLVAEKVVGWQYRLTELNDEQLVLVPPTWTDFSTRVWWGRSRYELVPKFSTDIAAAWTIVTFLRGRGFSLHLSEWQCIQGPCIEASFDPPYDEDIRPRGVVVLADSAPLAICKAALAVIESLAERGQTL